MSRLPYRSFPLVLAAPSGTGKTTIAHALVERLPHFVFSVSATTRSARAGEIDGEDYEFLTESTFREWIDRDELVEWAEVHGNLYGTPRKNLMKASERGEHVVLDIDVQGARQIRKRVPDAVLIFVFPPSARALMARLVGRGTEASPEVVRRMQAGRQELEEARHFDYVVVNDDLDGAVRRIQEIVDGESHRPLRARHLERDIARLQADLDGILEELGASEPPTTRES
ncbi:MAG: guanylate kinase [Gemmatimonadota bacterium]